MEVLKPKTFRLEHSGKTAVITGAASGLGSAIARRLAKDGWDLALCDINLEGLKLIKEELSYLPIEVRIYTFDVTEELSWKNLERDLRSHWQNIDLLVNNAGVTASGKVGSMPLKEWRKIIDVNLWGYILGTHTLVSWLKTNPNGGKILNVSSILSFIGAPSAAAYSISKAGVLSFSESLYAELKEHGIKVTVLCPAFFPTPLLENSNYADNKDREYAHEQARKSKMTPEKVADYSIDAVYRGRFYAMTPFIHGRVAWFLKRLMPRIFLRIVEFIGRRRLSSSN